MEQSQLKSVSEHIDDLKKMLKFILIAAALLFLVGCAVSSILIKSIVSYYGLSLFALSPFEYINTQIGVSLMITLLGIMPILIFKLYFYIKPAINTRKTLKLAIYPMIVGYLGFFFGVFVLAKYGLSAMASYMPSYIGLSWGMTSTIAFIMYMGLSMALVSQIMFIIPILTGVGLIERQWLTKYRKNIFFGLFVFAGLITPPDPITIFLVAIPLYICFEIGLVISYINERRKTIWQSERQNGLLSQV